MLVHRAAHLHDDGIARAREVGPAAVGAVLLEAAPRHPRGDQAENQRERRQCRPHLRLEFVFRLGRRCGVLVVAHVSRPLDRIQRTPVWPKPPWPRALSSKVSTTCNVARTIGNTTSCAIRSPGEIVKASRPRFHVLISSGPW